MNNSNLANRKDILDNWLDEGLPILTTDKKREFELSEDEYFVQCFKPGEPVREELQRLLNKTKPAKFYHTL